MRRWFEIGELDDTTYAARAGDVQFLQLPQKAEFIAFLNQYVNKIVRVTNNLGDSTLCNGVNDGSGTHPISNVPPCEMITVGSELRGMILFTGLTPAFVPLCRQYFERPGVNDGPNAFQTVEPPAKTHAGGDFSGARGLFTFAQQLGLVAQAILSLRNPVGGKLYAQRVAGVVLEIQNNIFKLRITVIQGSNQLHDLVLANQAIFEQISK